MTCLKYSRNLNLVCRGISPTQCTNFKTLGLYCLKSSCTWFPQFTHVYRTDLIAISQAIQICIKHGLIIYAHYPLNRKEVMLVIIHRWFATHNAVRGQRHIVVYQHYYLRKLAFVLGPVIYVILCPLRYQQRYNLCMPTNIICCYRWSYIQYKFSKLVKQ